MASSSGGPARSTIANCRAVHRVDPEVRFTLATTRQGLDREWRERVEAGLPPGTKLLAFPAHGRAAFTFSPRLAAWLRAHVAGYDVVVVRVLFHPISTAAAWIARRCGVPYVVVPHGTLSGYTFSHRRTLMKHTYFRLVERRTLIAARAVRFTCRAEREEAPDWGGRETRTPVIPHPYEPRFVKGGTPDRDDQQILFLSRLDPKKGLDVILKAMPQVSNEFPGVRLVLAGSGRSAFERRLKAQIRRAELERAVDLPGFVEGSRKDELLSSSAVFVLPSAHESFGNAVAEAIDAGLPVVISRSVGVAPEVEAAGAGLVLDARTPESLAGALLRLLRDEGLRRDMGRRGRHLVESAFSPERVGRELADLYREAAASTPVPTVMA